MIYIHIPFCKQACHYCDFHFSTNLVQKEKMVESICQEIELKKKYLLHNSLESIYFGGGTPSLLTENDLEKIFQTIRSNFTISENAEITLEANPDDLSVINLAVFKKVGINRLSIGIQSFNENHLKFMNRAHNANEALNCVKYAQNAGFTNISIDLIYSIPSENHDILKQDLEIATKLGVNHISAYCLTIEPKTTFGYWVKTKKMAPMDDNFASEQFEILVNSLAKNGFQQYEISNFARNNQISKHNSNYWFGTNYLGIGPSAHSFNGKSRQFNIANNSLYIKGIENCNPNFEIEILSEKDKTNEYLMTSLRTIWGTNLSKLHKISKGKFIAQNNEVLNKYIDKKWLLFSENTLKLSEKGKYFADLIASDLFID
jgi:oxygen-independent coproporphyrinogen III oxidase